MSKNSILFPFSISTVNFILLWKLFNDSRTWLIRLEFTKQIVSSTYLFHNDISLDNVGIIFCSSSTIKILAITGHSGDPMATPSICTYVLLFRVKCVFLVQKCNNSFTSCFGMLVFLSFLSYIILIVITIVYFKGTSVNSNTNQMTPFDIGGTIGGIFCFFSVFINDLLLLIVYCDWLGGFNIWAKYFASSYVAVLKYQIIGLSGKSSTVPFSLTFCNLLVL